MCKFTCLTNKSMFQRLYQAERIPPPNFLFLLMWAWDTGVMITCIMNEMQKLERMNGKKWSVFQLFKLVIACSPKVQNTLTTGKSTKLLFSLVNWHSRIDLLHLETYFSVKIIPVSLQYLVALFWSLRRNTQRRILWGPIQH